MSKQNNLSFVSVVIPCRNEEKFIGKCLDSIITQDYQKDRIEILIIDGMSEDKTREIVNCYIHQCPYIKLFDNPKKITPFALNTGIKKARGEIIIRMDAHATYKEDYVSKCIKYLNECNADNVGGVMITLPMNDTLVGRAIVRALSSPFGVGNSAFRTGVKEPKWVDTVFGGCYRREIFEKVGFFNENLASTQDMEFNLRLKRAGGKILLHPGIVSYYYTRSRFKDFCKNNFRNGVWAIYPMKFVKNMPVSVRHLVPFIFVSTLMTSGFLSIFFPVLLQLFLFTIGSYFASSIFFSAKIMVQEKEPRYLFVMPIMFLALHFMYGLGSIWGGIKLLWR